MKDKKESFRREEKDFFPKDSAALFDASKVYHSVGMKREVNKAWVWGLTWGLANKYNIGSKLYRWTVSLSGYAVSLSFGGLVRMYASSNLTAKAVGKFGILAGLKIQSAKKFVEYVIGKASARISRTFLGSIYKFFVTLVKKIPSPATSFIASVLDAGVTGTFVYAAVYTRLSATKAMLGRVHFSPEVAVYLSLDSATNKKEEDFLDATRKTFYPVCHFFATRVNNFERSTVISGKKSEIKAAEDKKIEGCLTSIGTFEGISLDHVETSLAEMSSIKGLDNSYSLYFQNKHMSSDEVKDLLKSIQLDYPAHYRMVWIAALKAIYPIDKVPDEFYIYKDTLILGKPNFVNGFFEEYISISTHKSAEHINTDRFTYSIERLVFATNKLKKKKKEDLGEEFKEEDKVSASEAFGMYWNYFKKQKGKVDEVLKKMLEKRERSWWGKVWDGLDEAARGLKWLWDDLRLLTGMKTYAFQVDSEIEIILKDY